MNIRILGVVLAMLVAFGAVQSAVAFQEEEIEFQSGEWTLKGTLTLPEGDGPFPTAVLFHGSGPNDRDETISFNDANSVCLYPDLAGTTSKLFRDLAHALADRGVAVLRYDKRTYLYGGELNAYTTSPIDFVLDGIAAVDYLMTRSEVDDNNIIVIGHSQGGSFLPLVARERSASVSAMVAMAAPARPIDSVLVEQIRYITRTCGDSAQGESTARQLEDAFALVRKGAWNAGTPILGGYAKFWEDWIAMVDATIDDFNDVPTPSLFIQGDEDINVRVENLERFRTQVTRGSTHTVLFEGLTHYFSTLDDPAMPLPVADTIVAWLQREQLVSSVARNHAPTVDAPVVHVRNEGGTLSFSVEGSIGSTQVLLFDMLGRQVEEAVRREGGTLSIPTGSLAPGLYLYEVRTGQGRSTGRCIITAP